QTLFEIRKAFGEQHACLVSDSFNVLLDPALFETDLGRSPSRVADDATELLEGFDIGEEGFEDWLRTERTKLRDCPTTVGTEPRAVDAPARKDEDTPPCPQHTMVLVRDAQQRASILADSLVDTIAKTIAELAAARIIDRRADPRGGVDT